MHRPAAILALLAIAIPLPALALPDAQLVRVTAQGSDFRHGDRVPLQIDVRNSGDSPLPALPVTLMVGEELYAEWKTPPDLPPGATASWSLTWIARRGSFRFLATADPLNELHEASEINNSAFINIGAGERSAPTPWAAILAGVLSFLVALVLGFLLGRFLLFRRRPPAKLSRFAPKPPPPASRT